MHSSLRAACVREWLLSQGARRRHDLRTAEYHLHRLHTLGAHSTRWRVRAHHGFLRLALDKRQLKSVLVQAGLLLLARLAPVFPVSSVLGRRALPGQPARRKPLPAGVRRAMHQVRTWVAGPGGTA